MSQDLQNHLDEITDEDIAWAESILKLPPGAFAGEHDSSSRKSVLKSLKSIDVEACPGSGKTTLVVAKLAILGRKWTARTSGLCVLSHTNVARNEIEKRLAGTEVSHKLLSYPHFVGTIHAFINEFLAIPLLRSIGFDIKVIDDDICLSHRWNMLPRGAEHALKQRYYGQTALKVRDPTFGVGRLGKIGEHTSTYREVRRVCEETSRDGYFCHDEMLVWSEVLLDQNPKIVNAIRCRFPFLFVDEVQDNSEVQSRVLSRVFQEGVRPVVRQRFGDSNQAIYQHNDQTVEVTDAFPEEDRKIVIPNSHRFHQEIADRVKPLGANYVDLVGCGPNDKDIETDASGKCACFLFDEQSVNLVLQNYAQYLVETFTCQELGYGTFTAVGARVRVEDENKDKIPQFLNHYWSEFDSELTKSEPQPKTFKHFIEIGEARFLASGENHKRLDSLANGILRGIMIANPKKKLQKRRRAHRYLKDLVEQAELQNEYCELVAKLFQGTSPIDEESWLEQVVPLVQRIIEKVAPDGYLAARLTDFMAYSDKASFQIESCSSVETPRDNTYCYPKSNPQVRIRLGSIHSVKGETHTATLVLETFVKAHNLKNLKRWILGKKTGNQSGVNLSRLRLHYVAMSRPSHLLCLAMREDCFKTAELNDLRELWKVARVSEHGPEWL